MKSTGAKRTVNTSSKRKQGVLPIIGAGLVVLVLLLMFSLVMTSYKGGGDDYPVVLIFGADEEMPEAMLRNTMHASGFEYYFVSDSEKYSDMQLVLPVKYRHRDVIVMSLSDNGFDYVKAYADLDNVKGFVLVCPDFPGNASMEGISSKVPAKDIAIFAGKDNARVVSDVKGARLIYERISGDDTVYGTPIKRGGKFSSECFISAEQNRYLSLSCFKYSDGNEMLKSPIFLSELASYLSVTHSDIAGCDMDNSRISMWAALAYSSVFFAIAAFAFYLLVLPKDRPSVDKPINSKINLNRTYVVLLSMTSVIAITSVVLRMISKTSDYAPYVLVMAPVAVVAYMMITSIKYIGKINSKIDVRELVRGIFMGVSEIVCLLLLGLIFANLGVDSKVALSIIIIVSVIDAITSGLLDVARKAGAVTYYGNIKVQGILLVPAIIALLSGLIIGRGLVTYGLFALASVIIPLVFVTPIRRHANNPIVVGIVHGASYLLIALALF